MIPGSPAARAGVHNDDVIVEFDGVAVTTINQVFEFPLNFFLVISHYSA